MTKSNAKEVRFFILPSRLPKVVDVPVHITQLGENIACFQRGSPYNTLLSKFQKGFMCFYSCKCQTAHKRSFARIPRTWSQTQITTQRASSSHAASGSMMDLWLLESPLHQPYHAINEIMVHRTSDTPTKAANHIVKSSDGTAHVALRADTQASTTPGLVLRTRPC
ncbi:hypothetical protein BDP81DRAFT_140582 [Colletotrichum phormii]|uniref:Uncharacterized protein n=1 Tax=Colletotrichum phormii TaxID=359342 RepID=A0AAI9ZE56_9PEZI|nr:uncharacterized protein BDP81DRAFT_140582 [Colletotrichum phormii]KAK1622879.1 hypothetical protein BDP81DRAFT_140582 [Colletotrichum phormii]